MLSKFILIFLLCTGMIEFELYSSYSRVNGPDNPFPVINIEPTPFQPPDYSFSYEIPDDWFRHEQFYPEYFMKLESENRNGRSSIHVTVNISVKASEDPYIIVEKVHIPHDEYFRKQPPYFRKDHITNIETLNVAGLEIYHVSYDANPAKSQVKDHLWPLIEAYTFVKGERRYTFVGCIHWGDIEVGEITKHMINSIQFYE